jgi:hypothetical protein
MSRQRRRSLKRSQIFAKTPIPPEIRTISAAEEAAIAAAVAAGRITKCKQRRAQTKVKLRDFWTPQKRPSPD